MPDAIIYEFGSTNLVFDLGLALLILLGWPFLAAEITGSVLMIVLLAVAFQLTLGPRLVEAAHRQAE